MIPSQLRRTPRRLTTRSRPPLPLWTKTGTFATAHSRLALSTDTPTLARLTASWLTSTFRKSWLQLATTARSSATIRSAPPKRSIALWRSYGTQDTQHTATPAPIVLTTFSFLITVSSTRSSIMSPAHTDPVGKRVVEDVGVSLGRTRDWPAVPKGLCKRVPVHGSTTIKCDLCGSPWGGLVYVSEAETFRHRQQPCLPFQ